MKISLKDIKNGLKRDEMRAVHGGCGGGGGLNKCCWSGTNNCSSCTSGTVCVSGAVLRSC